jgi:hypothetical protein
MSLGIQGWRWSLIDIGSLERKGVDPFGFVADGRTDSRARMTGDTSGMGQCLTNRSTSPMS